MTDHYPANPATEEHFIVLCHRHGPEQRIVTLAGELVELSGQSQCPR